MLSARQEDLSRALWRSYDVITGWAVAVTCYISHSAKHRKMADFDRPSGSQNRTDFDETWHGWLRLGPHPTWQIGGVAQRGWSGQICDLSHLWVSFLSLFAFFSARPGRISWPIGTIYMPKRVFVAKDVPFWVSTISVHLGGQTMKTSVRE